MTELETKIEADEFTDELSDEALDRAEGAFGGSAVPIIGSDFLR